MPKGCTINGNAWKYERGSYDEDSKENMAINLTRSCSFPATQFKMCSAPVAKE